MTSNALNNESSEFTVDNIFLDANTISTLDTNGDLILDPNGTGTVNIDYASQYDVALYNANGALGGATPSATTGVPLISQGNAANPTFGTAVVAGGGTGLTSATAYAVICGGTTATGAFQSIASVGTAGQVLTSNGAAALPTFQDAGGGGGIVVQQARSSSNSLISVSAQIPADNTIPQITEGVELLTVAITPQDAANILVIDFSFSYSIVTSQTCVAALFVDATADAIAAFPFQNANASSVATGSYFLTAGSTTARTYRLRMGRSSASGTITFNPAILSTVIFSSLKVTELTP